MYIVQLTPAHNRSLQILSFEPVAINCFRIGGGWDNANSRIPLSDMEPGSRFNRMQLIAEPPAEEFDENDVDAFTVVMGDDLARNLLRYRLEDAGYEIADDADGMLKINIWSQDTQETGKSISSRLYRDFFTAPSTENIHAAHSGDGYANSMATFLLFFQQHVSSRAHYSILILNDGQCSASRDLKPAAYGGYAPAQHLFGLLTMHGLYGVKQDDAEARKLLTAAAGQGHEHARQVLDGSMSGMKPALGVGGFNLGVGGARPSSPGQGSTKPAKGARRPIMRAKAPTR